MVRVRTKVTTAALFLLLAGLSACIPAGVVPADLGPGPQYSADVTDRPVAGARARVASPSEQRRPQPKGKRAGPRAPAKEFRATPAPAESSAESALMRLLVALHCADLLIHWRELLKIATELIAGLLITVGLRHSGDAPQRGKPRETDLDPVVPDGLPAKAPSKRTGAGRPQHGGVVQRGVTARRRRLACRS